MHEANYNKFMQNKNLKQELLNATGTTIAPACPFQADWCTGYFAIDTDCHDRHKWTSMNTLGEILTNLCQEIIHVSNIQIKNVTQVNEKGADFEPEIGLGTLQKACPEIGYYFKYIEEKIQPNDAKWDRRVLNDYRDYYKPDGVLWHIGNTKGQTRSIQEYMHPKAVPVCLRQELMH